MENKKPDLRDQSKGSVSITPPEALQAGIDNPNVASPLAGMNELTPDKPKAQGQVTRNS